jgi:hypothetical protein
MNYVDPTRMPSLVRELEARLLEVGASVREVLGTLQSRPVHDDAGARFPGVSVAGAAPGGIR